MERVLRCDVGGYFFACVKTGLVADVAPAQFADKIVWVGENYTSRDDMKNALYSRAKVSRFDVFPVRACTDGLGDELLQSEGLGMAD